MRLVLAPRVIGPAPLLAVERNGGDERDAEIERGKGPGRVPAECHAGDDGLGVPCRLEIDAGKAHEPGLEARGRSRRACPGGVRWQRGSWPPPPRAQRGWRARASTSPWQAHGAHQQTRSLPRSSGQRCHQRRVAEQIRAVLGDECPARTILADDVRIAPFARASDIDRALRHAAQLPVQHSWHGIFSVVWFPNRHHRPSRCTRNATAAAARVTRSNEPGLFPGEVARARPKAREASALTRGAAGRGGVHHHRDGPWRSR